MQAAVDDSADTRSYARLELSNRFVHAEQMDVGPPIDDQGRIDDQVLMDVGDPERSGIDIATHRAHGGRHDGPVSRMAPSVRSASRMVDGGTSRTNPERAAASAAAVPAA